MAWRTDRGYRVEHRPGHPLARADGSVRVHRRVLFDRQLAELGCTPGELLEREQPCAWCGWGVSWGVVHRVRGSVGERWSALVVDHLQGRGDDEATCVSCPWCNSNRAAAARLGVELEQFRGVAPWLRPRLGADLARLLRGRRRRRVPAGGPAPVRVGAGGPAVTAGPVDRLGRRRRAGGRGWAALAGVAVGAGGAGCVAVWSTPAGWVWLAALVGGVVGGVWWAGPAADPRRVSAGEVFGSPPAGVRRDVWVAWPAPEPEPEPEPVRPRREQRRGRGGGEGPRLEARVDSEPEPEREPEPPDDDGGGCGGGVVLRFPRSGDRVASRRRRQPPGPLGG